MISERSGKCTSCPIQGRPPHPCYSIAGPLGHEGRLRPDPKTFDHDFVHCRWAAFRAPGYGRLYITHDEKFRSTRTWAERVFSAQSADRLHVA